MSVPYSSRWINAAIFVTFLVLLFFAVGYAMDGVA